MCGPQSVDGMVHRFLPLVLGPLRVWIRSPPFSVDFTKRSFLCNRPDPFRESRPLWDVFRGLHGGDLNEETEDPKTGPTRGPLCSVVVGFGLGNPLVGGGVGVM